MHALQIPAGDVGTTSQLPSLVAVQKQGIRPLTVLVPWAASSSAQAFPGSSTQSLNGSHIPQDWQVLVRRHNIQALACIPVKTALGDLVGCLTVGSVQPLVWEEQWWWRAGLPLLRGWALGVLSNWAQVHCLDVVARVLQAPNIDAMAAAFVHVLPEALNPECPHLLDVRLALVSAKLSHAVVFTREAGSNPRGASSQQLLQQYQQRPWGTRSSGTKGRRSSSGAVPAAAGPASRTPQGAPKATSRFLYDSAASKPIGAPGGNASNDSNSGELPSSSSTPAHEPPDASISNLLAGVEQGTRTSWGWAAAATPSRVPAVANPSAPGSLTPPQVPGEPGADPRESTATATAVAAEVTEAPRPPTLAPTPSAVAAAIQQHAVASGGGSARRGGSLNLALATAAGLLQIGVGDDVASEERPLDGERFSGGAPPLVRGHASSGVRPGSPGQSSDVTILGSNSMLSMLKRRGSRMSTSLPVPAPPTRRFCLPTAGTLLMSCLEAGDAMTIKDVMAYLDKDRVVSGAVAWLGLVRPPRWKATAGPGQLGQSKGKLD